MHPEPDVPPVSDVGLSRVQTHTDPNLDPFGPVVLCKRLLDYNGGSQGRVSAGKCEKERISLRVDLATPPRLYRLPQDAPVLVEDVVVPLSELLEQPCRALDVSEEEGDGPSRELGHSVGVLAL
jgi:hypothetical protein